MTAKAPLSEGQCCSAGPVHFTFGCSLCAAVHMWMRLKTVKLKQQNERAPCGGPFRTRTISLALMAPVMMAVPMTAADHHVRTAIIRPVVIVVVPVIRSVVIAIIRRAYAETETMGSGIATCAIAGTAAVVSNAAVATPSASFLILLSSVRRGAARYLLHSNKNAERRSVVSGAAAQRPNSRSKSFEKIAERISA